MDRKQIAQETVKIQRQGFYEFEGRKVDFFELQRASVQNSVLITPEQWQTFTLPNRPKMQTNIVVTAENTVDAVLRLRKEGKAQLGVLNFASAKNPGGGFLNGAMAQEESLAAASGLYETLCKNPLYYEKNRAYKSMMYTDHAIFSPEVVFFRDGSFHLIAQPVTASVLTMPAVNLGQVIQKGEDIEKAKAQMCARMRLCLLGFAHMGCRHLILGAYGCGVFRNDPSEVAAWWKRWLDEEFHGFFDSITFAVYDRSKNQACIHAFEQVFGKAAEVGETG